MLIDVPTAFVGPVSLDPFQLVLEDMDKVLWSVRLSAYLFAHFPTWHPVEGTGRADSGREDCKSISDGHRIVSGIKAGSSSLIPKRTY